MKTIVSTQQADLQAELQRDLLKRGDLRLVVTKGLKELVAALQQGADLCLLGRNLDGASVSHAIAAIRADKKLALVPVVLLSGGGGLERGERRGDFEEVLELPAPPGALSLVLSRYLGVPLREGERFAVRVHVFSTAPAEGREAQSDGPPPAEYLGTTVDLSEVGLMLKTRRPLPVGDRLAIRFTLPGHPGELDLQARVVRTDERGYAPELGVALGFTALSEVDRRALRDYLQTLQSGRPFRWHIVREGDRQVISLSGVLRADADLQPLRQLRGELDFRLRDFRRISSDSIQTWLDLIRSLRGASKIRLFECPIAFIQQANAISNLLEQTQVCSFYAPYVCPRCGLDEERLIDVARDLAGDGAVSRRPPSYPCPSCGTALVFDDLPERYFAFL